MPIFDETWDDNGNETYMKIAYWRLMCFKNMSSGIEST